VKNKKEHIDVVIATPPCQGMSIANHKKNNELNRNSLVIESLELILKLSPKYFVLENVRSFLTTMCTDSQGEIKTIKRAIISMLSGSYNIDYNVVNLINYGSNSSRPRTIVIGVRKDIKEVTPFDIFPRNRQAPTLRKLISDLPKLKKMDEVSDNDIYHSYRKFDTRMLNWIKDLKPGESAFGNINFKNKPHRIVDGKMILNAEKNSDKYRRCEWDKYAPCVHTRNDILASQNTVHPEQNRVFSIRELMRF
jgi:DNA (cytosine-5)-methyltransferase 1